MTKYKNIHNNLIKYCRETTPNFRLSKRNSNDPRLLSSDPLYVEIHHIIPRSLGGKDTPKNLIELLPEEHIFIHMLRYKIFSKREDMLAVRCMLNCYNNYRLKNLKIVLNKKIRMGYAWMRSNIQNFRLKNEWHTEDGVKRISESRKGTMPVKDVKTGKMIGSVSVKHPNVLSGKWVHHSKNRVVPLKERKLRSFMGLGQKNNNASGLSDEDLLCKGEELFKEFNRIISLGETLKLSFERGFKWIKSYKSRFNGGGMLGYYSALEKRVGQKYDPYFKQKNRKKNCVKN